MKRSTATTAILLAAVALLCSGCARIASQIYLSRYEGDIRKAARAIEEARDNAQRAAAYAERGSAYAEKARYLRAFKLTPAAEYNQIFEMAVKDHDQAVGMDPGNPDVYFRRGMTCYVIAALDTSAERTAAKEASYASAKTDFSTVIEKDPRNPKALEMRGQVEEVTGERDQAIADYERESALDPKDGARRLADAYCHRGSYYTETKQYDLAAADFEKSIRIGTSADGCDCEPFNPLVWIYLDQQHDMEKAREVVRRAQDSRKWIAPEYLEKLKH
jgi:tetratricopeptide (TPR) repeat protein